MYDEYQSDRAEIAFRRRALQTNSAIYARHNGPGLLRLLSGAEFRSRCAALIYWLGSEPIWQEADARRIGALALEIARLGRSQGASPTADDCAWHAARLRELAAQHAVLHRLESQSRPASPWFAAPPSRSGSHPGQTDRAARRRQ